MNESFDCPHCLSVNVVPEDEYFDGLCGSCGNDVYTLPDTEDEGDVYEVASGLEIVTPAGRWHLHDEEAIQLITGLSSMLHSRLTRPWSAENDSTILTRGRIHPRPVGLPRAVPNPNPIHKIQF